MLIHRRCDTNSLDNKHGGQYFGNPGTDGTCLNFTIDPEYGNSIYTPQYTALKNNSEDEGHFGPLHPILNWNDYVDSPDGHSADINYGDFFFPNYLGNDLRAAV